MITLLFECPSASKSKSAVILHCLRVSLPCCQPRRRRQCPRKPRRRRFSHAAASGSETNQAGPVLGQAASRRESGMANPPGGPGPRLLAALAAGREQASEFFKEDPRGIAQLSPLDCPRPVLLVLARRYRNLIVPRLAALAVCASPWHASTARCQRIANSTAAAPQPLLRRGHCQGRAATASRARRQPLTAPNRAGWQQPPAPSRRYNRCTAPASAEERHDRRSAAVMPLQRLNAAGGGSTPIPGRISTGRIF